MIWHSVLAVSTTERLDPHPELETLVEAFSGQVLDSERGNFKLFGLIYWLYLRKFELFGARLLKKRGF